MAYALPYLCPNAVRGCQQYLDEMNSMKHQEECIYRIVKCPDLVCANDVTFWKVLRHMDRSNHWAQNWANAYFGAFGIRLECYLGLRYDCQKPCRICFDGRIFVFNGFQSIENETVYYWIQLIGSPSEAKNYSYMFVLHGNRPNVYNVYYGEVNSINETSEDIVGLGKYFGIKIDALKAQFMNENRRFKFSIGIRKLTN